MCHIKIEYFIFNRCVGVISVLNLWMVVLIFGFVKGLSLENYFRGKYHLQLDNVIDPKQLLLKYILRI